MPSDTMNPIQRENDRKDVEESDTKGRKQLWQWIRIHHPRQMWSLSNHIPWLMDEGAALKLIYTDFTKAFDTLQSEFSLAKLIQIG